MMLCCCYTFIFQLTCSYIILLNALLEVLRNKMYVKLCHVTNESKLSERAI